MANNILTFVVVEVSIGKQIEPHICARLLVVRIELTIVRDFYIILYLKKNKRIKLKLLN